MSYRGIMINQDITEFYYTRRHIIDDIDKKDLETFIDQYNGTDVTDFCICVNGVCSLYPSKVKTFFGDTDDKMKKYGLSFDGGRYFTYGTNLIWKEKKLDQIKIWIDRCRKNNINPWISFRMNDVHCQFDDSGFLLDDNFISHNEDQARIRHRKQFQYFDRARDFELEPVRQEMLEYIEETLERYDVYGIELDFQREVFCFESGCLQRNWFHYLNKQKTN